MSYIALMGFVGFLWARGLAGRWRRAGRLRALRDGREVGVLRLPRGVIGSGLPVLHIRFEVHFK